MKNVSFYIREKRKNKRNVSGGYRAKFVLDVSQETPIHTTFNPWFYSEDGLRQSVGTAVANYPLLAAMLIDELIHTSRLTVLDKVTSTYSESILSR